MSMEAKITKQTSLLFDLTKESVNYRRGEILENKRFKECLQCKHRWSYDNECEKLNQKIEYYMCCDLFIDRKWE